MSIRLMTMIWDIKFPTQSQLLVALKLADHANDEGTHVWPSRARIADLTQCSESTVKHVLRAFREIGLLHVVEEGGKGPRDTTKYAFHMRLIQALEKGLCSINGDSEKLEIEWLDKGVEFDPLKGAENPPLEIVRGQPSPVRGEPGDAKGGASYPQIITNHQKESPGAGARAFADASASTAPRPASAIVVRAGEAAFANWIEHLHKLGRSRLADWARDEGALRVTKRFPSGEDLPLDNPRFEPEGLSDLTKRIIGEAAQ